MYISFTARSITETCFEWEKSTRHQEIFDTIRISLYCVVPSKPGVSFSVSMELSDCRDVQILNKKLLPIPINLRVRGLRLIQTNRKHKPTNIF